MNSLSTKRILILEDDVLLALDAAETIEEMGAVVVGPAHRIESAMTLLDSEQPHAALLDVNIAGSSSAEVAARLLRSGVPFVLATGYGAQHDIPGSRTVIDKPYNRKQLQAALIDLFDESADQASNSRNSAKGPETHPL